MEDRPVTYLDAGRRARGRGVAAHWRGGTQPSECRRRVKAESAGHGGLLCRQKLELQRRIRQHARHPNTSTNYSDFVC
eukprot:2002845-Pleurochrysis_carterae.AAC.1